MQIGVVLASFFVLLIQLAVYDIIDEDIIVFNDQCEVEIGPEADGKVRQGAIMMCGDEQRGLGTLEIPYFYKVLTTDRNPVIVCVKTVSKHLKSINWTCEMDPTEDETV